MGRFRFYGVLCALKTVFESAHGFRLSPCEVLGFGKSSAMLAPGLLRWVRIVSKYVRYTNKHAHSRHLLVVFGEFNFISPEVHSSIMAMPANHTMGGTQFNSK